ncbi:hypothetical protein JTE90_010838 [Oedothorax gibbosus]|uniref:Uncharacterized protein n=1 Tax=Oedothorax gibbosus TaxID=931172 RepID=A0AAV6V2Y3_9ARAC|nr:hypothetical protein JTE90_010838 [Oedothorax gibbosus]
MRISVDLTFIGETLANDSLKGESGVHGQHARRQASQQADVPGGEHQKAQEEEGCVVCAALQHRAPGLQEDPHLAHRRARLGHGEPTLF